ncbi:MAG: beta-ketoacyl synthase, partial [Pseudomonadales bacterium]|nr:beta-ketoacyl synthase [Pseudomonadales bacterium]
MARLPLIVSFGGINPAGRGSGFNAYRRLIFDKLSSAQQLTTLQNLATLTGKLRQQDGSWIDGSGSTVELEAYLQALQPELLTGTLIRKLESEHFDTEAVTYHQKAQLQATDQQFSFTLRKKQLPSPVPDNWQVTAGVDGNHVTITTDSLSAMLPAARESEVKSAGQLPTGFDPASTYSSRNHPRALQMTVFGASDAIQALGIDWETLKQLVPPDQISVYAGSCLSQLDYNGNGGMLQARLLGKKVTSKQLPLGLNEMPADFLNAYLLGSLGTTGHSNGACATFLYNLRQGIRDIQSGSHRIAVIGTSESSLVPEVFDAFTTMGALASDASLRELDKLAADCEPDFRRACRPFAENSGFTVAESAQFIVLFDDQLAMETGANVYGAVNDVFVNADGHKKSITGPGLGNYLTMAKATSATKNIIGEERLRHATWVQAHGTGTPQNRVTEAAILNKVAGTFGISDWPVAAIKSYLGHSVASAAGDQLLTSLGVWKDGILPGILTTHNLAADVEDSNLDFMLQHREVDPLQIDAVLINSKGFGGNNASASVLAPHVTQRMLTKRHGAKVMQQYQERNAKVQEQTADYINATNRGDNRTIYKFDHNVLDASALEMSDHSI